MTRFSRPLRRFRISTLIVVVAAAACGAEAPDRAGESVRSDDPELQALAEELLPDLARRSGLELVSPVRVERRSRELLEEYLVHRLDQDLPPREAERITASYRLLGLVPEDLDLRSLLLEVYAEQVVGFYDPDSTALFVLDDQPREALRPVLVHELVHAVQDQHFPLDSLSDRERGNDRQTAAYAAIEGHATLVMLEHLTEEATGEEVDLTDLPDFSGAVRPALEALGAEYPALAGAPRILRETLLFPYVEGASFVQFLWRESEGRPPPFGPRLPLSTHEVLEPGEVLGEDRPLPVELELSGPGERVYSNTLGRLEIQLLLEEHLGGTVGGVTGGWRGDRYMLMELPEEELALVWAAVWSDAGIRDRFVEALGTEPTFFPGPARLESRTVEGHPVSLLRVGVPDGADVVVEVRNGG